MSNNCSSHDLSDADESGLRCPLPVDAVDLSRLLFNPFRRLLLFESRSCGIRHDMSRLLPAKAIFILRKNKFY
jgi:hypothetical protein